MTENLLKQIAQKYEIPLEIVKGIYYRCKIDHDEDIKTLAKKWNLPYEETLKRVLIGFFETIVSTPTLGPGASERFHKQREITLAKMEELLDKYIEKLLKE